MFGLNFVVMSYVKKLKLSIVYGNSSTLRINEEDKQFTNNLIARIYEEEIIAYSLTDVHELLELLKP